MQTQESRNARKAGQHLVWSTPASGAVSWTMPLSSNLISRHPSESPAWPSSLFTLLTCIRWSSPTQAQVNHSPIHPVLSSSCLQAANNLPPFAFPPGLAQWRGGSAPTPVSPSPQKLVRPGDGVVRKTAWPGSGNRTGPPLALISCHLTELGHRHSERNRGNTNTGRPDLFPRAQASLHSFCATSSFLLFPMTGDERWLFVLTVSWPPIRH